MRSVPFASGGTLTAVRAFLGESVRRMEIYDRSMEPSVVAGVEMCVESARFQPRSGSWTRPSVRCRAGWLEPVLDPIGDATRPQGQPCNEEQQRQAAWQMRNRVRSALTQLVMHKSALE
jgi:hypothetical protein